MPLLLDGLAPVERWVGALFAALGTPQGEDGVAVLPYRRFGLTGKSRALVTGGAGFIGGHLCERLLQEGY